MNNESTSVDRVEWLDFIRSLAITMVVFCHVTEGIYALNLDGIQNLSNISKIFAFICFSFGRIGVPLFLFLSGYLLLDRKYDSASAVFSFWKKKFVPLLITFELWTVINQLASVILYKSNFDMVLLIRRMLFLENSQFGHMWYMPMIVGMYLMIPFVGIIVQKFTFKVLLTPMILCFFYYFLVNNVNLVCNIWGINKLNSKMDLSFTGGVYGLYLVFGHECKAFIQNVRNENNFSTKSTRGKRLLLGITVTVSFFFTVFFQLWCYSNNYAYNVWYNFFSIFICAAALFLLIGSINHRYALRKLWNKISIASFGIYFIHFLVLKILLEDGRFLAWMRKPYRTILMLVCVFCVSFLIEESVTRLFPSLARGLFLKKTKQTQE